MTDTGPDVRPLGAIALGVAILGAVLSVTYFLSPLAFIAALIALPLGVVSRTHRRSRTMGTAAIVVALLSIFAATATLILV